MSVTAASTCSRFGSDVPLFCNNSACLASARAGRVSAISCVLEAGALTPTLPLLPRDPISMVFPPNRTRREKSYPFPRQSYRQLTLAQQAEDRLRQLVGLGQHRSTRLLHDLVLGQVGRLGCVVGVQYAAAGSGGVLSNVLQVADGRLEAVLHRTQLGTLAVDLLHGTVQNRDGLLCTFGSGDVQVADGGFNHHTLMLTSHVGQTQSSQAGAFAAISYREGLVTGEQLQSTVLIGAGTNTGTGSVDRGDDGIHVTALGQPDFSTIQVDRGVLLQNGLGFTRFQAKLLERATGDISQFDVLTILGCESQAAILAQIRLHIGQLTSLELIEHMLHGLTSNPGHRYPVDINTARVSQHSIRIFSGDSRPGVEADSAQISGDITAVVGDYQCVIDYRGGITSDYFTVDCIHDSGQIGTTVAIKG